MLQHNLFNLVNMKGKDKAIDAILQNYYFFTLRNTKCEEEGP